ncbi:MAG: MFS transporter [Candidatus Bathyarchaeota archaeon]|nr:MAG: MFS transporter [Candidatus Bathyarchaeota archaeon]
MNSNSGSTSEHSPPRRLVLPTLAFSRFVVGTPGILFGLLLIEIGLTFGSPVGVTGQIRTASSIMAVVSALAMGVLSVRFDHKTLLMVGLGVCLISALGCSLALSFGMMLLFYALTGMGMAMVMPMGSTLVAEYFPLERRTGAIGWLVAGGASSYLVGAQVIAFIAGIGGWRLAFLGFVLPSIIIGLFLVRIFLPRRKTNPGAAMGRGGYLEGLRVVASERAAAACLAGTALRSASFQVVLLYATSLVREKFLVSRGSASMYMTSAALCYILGSLLSGSLVERVGRKTTTVIALLLASVFTMALTLSNNLLLALATDFISALFFGMATSAGQSLNLEQVPRFRGPMMSMNSATMNIGAALGAGFGGFVILMYGYEPLGVALGVLGIIAALVIQFLAVDPTRA